MTTSAMAAILEEILRDHVTSQDVLNWVICRNQNLSQESVNILEQYEKLRVDFVPYFLNFLRDQTQHLVQGCRSTNNTPAKTPASIKSAKLHAPSKQSSIKGHAFSTRGAANSSSAKSNPVQLFGSIPLESDKQHIDQSLSTSSTFDASSRINDLSSHTFENSISVSGNWSHDSAGDSNNNSGSFKKHNQHGHKNISKQHAGNISSSSVHHHRSKRRSFGDFFQSPDADQQGRYRNSPLHHKTDHVSPSPSPKTGRRQVNKGKIGGYDKKNKANRAVLNEPKSAVLFNLSASDFPAMEQSPVNGPASKPTGIPAGATVITSSRRITTTLLSQSISQPSTNNSPFQITPLSSQPATRVQRSMWTQSPEVLRKNLIESGKSQVFNNVTEPVVKTKNARRVQTTLITSMEKQQQISEEPVWSPLMHKGTSAAAACPRTSTPCDQERISSPEEKFPKTISVVSMTATAPLPESDTKVPSGDQKGFVCGASPAKTPLKGRGPLASGLAITPSKTQLERMVSIEVVTASMEFVTHREVLDVLVKIYAGVISQHLVPNLTIEMFFIIQLLTSKNGEIENALDLNQELDEVAYFTSVHNAVYFAVQVLNSQRSLLNLLDRSALHLVAECQRVVDFSQELRDAVSVVHEQCPQKPSFLSLASPIGGVPFQADTDNRKNFPNEKTFHAFKKQRDQFYELLRDWEEKHMKAGWNMQEELGSRIASLVGRESHLANFVHLARLFQSQLIQMCKGDGQLHTEDENNIGLLSHLKLTNPDKLKRLQERFITPSSVGGPSPLPSFPGSQEFFRNFIIVASNSMFNHHLSVTMGAKIAELNTCSFDLSENENKEDGVQSDSGNEREDLITCLLTLKLLAKFLGLVSFLPYQSTEFLPETLQSHMISVRNKMQFTLDVAQCIVDAEAAGHLSLTLPWVTDFLSMMDSLAPKLRYFAVVFTHLLSIHRRCCEMFHRTGSQAMLLIITTLGWLFQLPLFPESLLYRDVDIHESSASIPRAGSLDCGVLIDRHLLHSVCPYMGEIRNLLVDFTVGLSSRHTTIKKITPISAEISPPAVSAAHKNLQQQLEENFFHQHPTSLRNTVDFIAERVGSNCIKCFRQEALMALQTEGHQRARELADQVPPGSPDKTKKTYQSKLDDIVMDLKKRTRERNSLTSKKYCQDKALAALQCVLHEDTSQHVLDVAAGISSRLAQHKVTSWLNSHITTNFLKREVQTEFDKQVKLREQIKNGERAAKTNPESANIPLSDTATGLWVHGEEYFISDILVDFKDMVQCVVSGDIVSCEKLSEQLDLAKRCFREARHQHPSARKSLAKLTQQLAYAIILQFPSRWSFEVQEALCDLWHHDLHHELTFTSMLCPKHLHLIKMSPDSKLSWKLWTRLIIQLEAATLLDPCTILDTNHMHSVAGFMGLVDICGCMTEVFSAHLKHTRPDHGKYIEYFTMLEATCQHINDAMLRSEWERCISKLRKLVDTAQRLQGPTRNSEQDIVVGFVDAFVARVMAEALKELETVLSD